MTEQGIEISYHFQNPNTATMRFRNWGLGGYRQSIEISMFELIQLRAEIDRVFKSIEEPIQ